jgi:hypothetical protein
VIDAHFDQELMTPEQIAREVGSDYSGLIPLLKEKLSEGFFLSAGHRCQVNDREFIHIILKREAEAVSVIITEKQGSDFPAADRVNRLDAQGVALYQDRLDSLEVVGFEAKGHLGFVVSAMDHGENFQVASRLAPAVSNFLSKL